MNIAGKTVIGYERVADCGINVFIKAAPNEIEKVDAVSFQFLNKQECDAFTATVRVAWYRHINSLTDGYIATQKG